MTTDRWNSSPACCCCRGTRRATCGLRKRAKPPTLASANGKPRKPHQIKQKTIYLCSNIIARFRTVLSLSSLSRGGGSDRQVNDCAPSRQTRSAGLSRDVKKQATREKKRGKSSNLHRASNFSRKVGAIRTYLVRTFSQPVAKGDTINNSID